MNLLDLLQSNTKEVLEKFAVEGDDLHLDGSNLHVNCDNFEEAADIRRSILDWEEYDCRLIAHQTTGKPTVEIRNIN